MTSATDFIEHLASNYCNCCGESLEHSAARPSGKRQVYDIPKIAIKVTEYHIYKKQSICGNITESEYPSETNAPVSYVYNIEGLIEFIIIDFNSLYFNIIRQK